MLQEKQRNFEKKDKFFDIMCEINFKLQKNLFIMCCCFCFFPFRGEKELLSGYLTSRQTARERSPGCCTHEQDEF